MAKGRPSLPFLSLTCTTRYDEAVPDEVRVIKYAASHAAKIIVLLVITESAHLARMISRRRRIFRYPPRIRQKRMNCFGMYRVQSSWNYCRGARTPSFTTPQRSKLQIWFISILSTAVCRKGIRALSSCSLMIVTRAIDIRKYCTECYVVTLEIILISRRW